MIGIGVGGLDVALAMAGQPYRLKTPEVVGIHLIKKLNDWVSSKDVIIQIIKEFGTNNKDRVFDVQLGGAGEVGPLQVMPFHVEYFEQAVRPYDLSDIGDLMAISGMVLNKKLNQWKDLGYTFNLDDMNSIQRLVRSWNQGVTKVSKNPGAGQEYWDRFVRNWMTSSWIMFGKSCGTS